MDFTPDQDLVVVPPTGSQSATASITIDLDGDGRQDFELAYFRLFPDNYYKYEYASVKALHADAAVMGCLVTHPALYNYRAEAVHAYSMGESINATPPTTIQAPIGPGGAATNVWTGEQVFFWRHRADRGTGTQVYGSWQDNLPHYGGLRVRASSSSSWQYGWVQTRYPNTNLYQGHFIISDYALGSAVLAAQSASAAGWQVYPTPTTGWLTVVPPGSAAPGRLTVRDLCGRVLRQAALTGGQQQLDLSTLATGLYVLELETAAGRVSQRIARQ